MAKIIKLDDHLSNKIAAGEVVERPASVVKELVENALDANSQKITIEVEAGGLDRIRVIDDGDGIEREDVETAFFRHATSKIKTDKDLFQIATLGFRGEALPSIASVSHVQIKTSTGGDGGTEMVLEGGVIKKIGSTAMGKGTDLTVTQLFYNTPARLKYVKTVHTELGNISDVVNRLALAHPHVSFQLFHNGKNVLRTSGNGDQLQVIAAIYGRTVAKQMVPLSGETIDFKVSGFAAKPEVTRASRQYMSLLVNGRYIRNVALSKAIQQGFHTLLPIGRYPIAIVNIELDPQLIDVNVHPSKLEVRVSKEEELCRLVTETIERAFKKEQLIPEATKPTGGKQKSEQLSFTLDDFTSAKPSEDRGSTSSNEGNEQRSSIDKNVLFQEEKKLSNDLPSINMVREASASVEPALEKEPPSAELTAGAKGAMEQASMEEETSNSLPVNRVPTMYPIGQMHGTYILAQNDQGLYIIDQHAAQERMKYEYFREKVGEVTNELQELIVPITVECTLQEAAYIEEHLEDLKQVGLFFEEFGPQTFMIRQHPTWFPKGLEEETIREMIDQLMEKRKVDIKKLREEAAILMSCKAAIKANRHLRHDEMYALLEALRKSSDPFTCPHGRPIIVQITTYEMEKMFKRVM
ncbi:DNA mismatch repair endonuclease MutL [Halalkalibacterium halodurans]|uniref:DNA mismatch repair endonuclease MutL n=1 Tax=Halalkalibacterium halodurans TaxID=86665 RepID=UPI0010688F7F|nr:DNA mismatch repair endonuclease MutL [Halalkalibacterium halodurans]TES50128.1 DNA mismatch repair endonuclease MutL [Halalkalibacterium halodurans]